MQQTIGDDSVKLLLLQRRIRQVMIFEADPRLESLVMDSTLTKSQHCVGTVHAKSGHAWKRPDEAHRDVGGSAAKIKNPSAGKRREPFAEIAGNLAVRFGPVCARVCRSLVLLVHE